jgi:cytochrome c553
MTPHPPPLTDRISSWSARELFFVVKHGVKFTGMPAWPAQQRDDEVWAVVSFLRRLPSLDRPAYDSLTRGGGESLLAMSDGAASSSAQPKVVEICVRCHGSDGLGRGHAFPTIAGQRLEYLMRAMTAYADGRRHSGIMEPIAAGLSAPAREAAARYYASLPARRETTAKRSDDVLRGEAVARRGVPEQEIPSCADCHADGDGPINDAYPRLSGQYAPYIVQQLKLLKARARGGSEYVHLMHSFVDRLTERQIADAAAYFASSR